jgi:arabinan endo-1,5-alpha-L-arabinosidase
MDEQAPITRRRMIGATLAAALVPAPPQAPADPPARFEVGEFRKIYSSDRGDGAAWHVNDHCFVDGPDGLWHMFGIAWTDPGSKPEPRRGFLEHATSPKLTEPDWKRREPVLLLEPELGETVMWAPHVVSDGGTFSLFVCTGGPNLEDWGITRATSKDLFSWTRDPKGPVFRDGFQARDPMVVRPPGSDRWTMYYTATEKPSGGRHVVASRTSRDLVRWSDREIAFFDDHRGTDFGPTESPFVVFREGWAYLFTGPRPYDRPTADRPNFRHPGYSGTDVFASRDGRSWTLRDRIGHVDTHAPELVTDRDGSLHISHCGIGQGGLFLAPFRWVD